MLEIKNTATGTDVFDGLISRLETAEESIYEAEETSKETSNTKKQSKKKKTERKQKKKKKKHQGRISKEVGTTINFVTLHRMAKPVEERIVQKKDLKL